MTKSARHTLSLVLRKACLQELQCRSFQAIRHEISRGCGHDWSSGMSVLHIQAGQQVTIPAEAVEECGLGAESPAGSGITLHKVTWVLPGRQI